MPAVLVGRGLVPIQVVQQLVLWLLWFGLCCHLVMVKELALEEMVRGWAQAVGGRE